jgi:hypothetical protein
MRSASSIRINEFLRAVEGRLDIENTFSKLFTAVHKCEAYIAVHQQRLATTNRIIPAKSGTILIFWKQGTGMFV